jgi:GAF domain-containing protein
VTHLAFSEGRADFALELEKTIGAESADASRVMALVAEDLRKIGIGLVTISAVSPEDDSFTRLYSTMPNIYPLDGRKPANRTRWSEVVIEGKKSFVANDGDSLAEVMSDHELLASLGFQSILNVPIILFGKVVGTLNCLAGAGHFNDVAIGYCERMRMPTLLALLASRGGGSFGRDAGKAIDQLYQR